MPLMPVDAPLIDIPRILTAFFVSATAVMLMMIPFVPAERIEPCVSSQSIVIDLVIVTAPKPPGSRQLISPFVAVFEIAPANVLHGAVRLHGLTSSPTPETQVRVACALTNKLQPKALAAAMRGGTAGWGQVASSVEHVRYAQPVRPASRRQCYCGCNQRATHLGMANGCGMTTACELGIQRWVRTGYVRVRMTPNLM